MSNFSQENNMKTLLASYLNLGRHSFDQFLHKFRTLSPPIDFQEQQLPRFCICISSLFLNLARLSDGFCPETGEPVGQEKMVAVAQWLIMTEPECCKAIGSKWWNEETEATLGPNRSQSALGAPWKKIFRMTETKMELFGPTVRCFSCRR